jgi:hypothetical protein
VLKLSSRIAQLWAANHFPIEGVRSHALDYRSIAFDPLDAGNGEFLHPGRIYSHSSNLGHRRGVGQADSGKKPGGLRKRIGKNALRSLIP